MSDQGSQAPIPKQDDPGGVYESAPFQAGLEYLMHPVATIGTSNELLTHGEADGRIVRAAHLDMLYGDLRARDEQGGREPHLEATPEEERAVIDLAMQRCQKAKALYAELEHDYGIAVPRFSYVIGEAVVTPDRPGIQGAARPNKGTVGFELQREPGAAEPMLYTVSEKIFGHPIQNIWNNNSGQYPSAAQYHDLFTGITRYIADKYSNGGTFISDFGWGISMIEQCMYGHPLPSDDSQQTPENKIYWHDVDPKLVDQKEDDAQATAHLGKMAYTIASDVSRLNHYFPDDISGTTIQEMVAQIQAAAQKNPNGAGADSMQSALEKLAQLQAKK